MYFSIIIIIVVWIILLILGGYTFSKMLNILVKNKKGSCFYCYWKLWLSFSFFKEFINESNFDSKRNEEYLLLYKRGLWIKRCVISFFLFLFILAILNGMQR